MIGTAICLLAMGSYLFASTIFLLLAVRILHGAGFGITTTTYGTVVSDLIPSARRGEGMGYFGLSGTIAISIHLSDYGLCKHITSQFFMCIIVHNCFININETTSNPKTKQPPQQSSSTFLDGFIERKALLPSLLILCITLMYGGIGSFITLFATEVGIADISLFFLCNALAIAVTRPFSGKLYDAKPYIRHHSGSYYNVYRYYFIVVYDDNSELNYCCSMLRKWFWSDPTCTTSMDD